MKNFEFNRELETMVAERTAPFSLVRIESPEIAQGSVFAVSSTGNRLALGCSAMACADGLLRDGFLVPIGWRETVTVEDGRPNVVGGDDWDEDDDVIDDEDDDEDEDEDEDFFDDEDDFDDDEEEEDDEE